MNRVEDFQLNLKTVYVNDINDGNYNKYGNYNSLADILEDQQLLIIGFADVYKYDGYKGNPEFYPFW